MYTAVLMLAMTSGVEAIDRGGRRGGCCGGCYSSYGGGYGGWGGCSGGWGGCSGGHGGWGGCSGGYYGGGMYRAGYGGYYGSPYYASGNYITPDSMGQYGATQQTQSFYYNPGQQDSQPFTGQQQFSGQDNFQGQQQGAMVRVLVPNSDAEIWFDNTATKQRGMERSFVSTSPLDSSSKYVYTIKARWNENGRQVDRERRVEVHPGQPVTVDFRTGNNQGNQGENLQPPKANNPVKE